MNHPFHKSLLGRCFGNKVRIGEQDEFVPKAHSPAFQLPAEVVIVVGQILDLVQIRKERACVEEEFPVPCGRLPRHGQGAFHDLRRASAQDEGFEDLALRVALPDGEDDTCCIVQLRVVFRLAGVPEAHGRSIGIPRCAAGGHIRFDAQATCASLAVQSDIRMFRQPLQTTYAMLTYCLSAVTRSPMVMKILRHELSSVVYFSVPKKSCSSFF